MKSIYWFFVRLCIFSLILTGCNQALKPPAEMTVTNDQISGIQPSQETPVLPEATSQIISSRPSKQSSQTESMFIPAKYTWTPTQPRRISTATVQISRTPGPPKVSPSTPSPIITKDPLLSLLGPYAQTAELGTLLSPDGKWLVRDSELSSTGGILRIISITNPKITILIQPVPDLVYALVDSWSPDSSAVAVAAPPHDPPGPVVHGVGIFQLVDQHQLTQTFFKLPDALVSAKSG